MYSNKENINILTALLVEYGVKDAVVCPGSRNAPIVHNLSECKTITCHPVTDERSAAFMAMGMAQVSEKPVVVCVTSGTALLNTAPAVAEAFYQHVPLVVISADRPQQWIGQLDGQTLPQPDALGHFVVRSVQLPEPRDDEQRWYCSRLVNEAMNAATCHNPAPVHINVPIGEPLFTFDVKQLPKVGRYNMKGYADCPSQEAIEGLQKRLYAAKRPLIVIGQMAYNILDCQIADKLSKHFVVFAEPLASGSYTIIHFDEAVRYIKANHLPEDVYAPDYIIYIGDTLVSKPARQWLRSLKVPSCIITPDPAVTPDPFMSLTDIVQCGNQYANTLLESLLDIFTNSSLYYDNKEVWQNDVQRNTFRMAWDDLLNLTTQHALDYKPEYSQMATVRYLEEQLADPYIDVYCHYANSTAIRLACIYACHYVWCNRGVNGIEGSLSTAAGFSTIADSDITLCVIGDLSFFYDQNALWNKCIDGNMRILLLNNSGGGIFKMLPGLGKSPVADSLVGAAHHTSAQGICSQNDIGYLAARNMEEMQIGVVTLLTRQTKRPMLLEVFTDANTDNNTYKAYFDSLTKKTLPAFGAAKDEAIGTIDDQTITE